MKHWLLYVVISFSFLTFACVKQKQQQNSFDFTPPKVVEARTYKVPKEKIVPPVVIPATGVKTVAAGKPEIIQLKSNVFPASVTRTVRAGAPKLIIPGGSFQSPKVVPAIDSPFEAGRPEVVLAKDLFIKEINPAGFSSIKAMHGLNSNEISSLCQDRAGNLWIGEWWGGVSKYDGRSLTNYSTQQGLSSDVVNSIYEDRSGNIWISTGNGVNKFDGRYITWYSTRNGLRSNTVWGILQDKNSDMWFATDSGLNRYDGHSFTHYTTAQGLPTNNIHGMLEDSKGNLWFGANGGLTRFDGHSFQNYTTTLHLKNTTEVISIIEDSSGVLWFATNNNGLFKYDGQAISQFTTQGGLSSNNISKIIKDNNGDLWITTWDHGFIKYDGQSFTHFGIEEGLGNEMVPSVLQDKYANLWLATTAGLFKYDGKLFSHIGAGQGLKEEVECIMADTKGNLWIGSGVGNYLNKYDGRSVERYTTAQGLISTAINQIIEDRHGNIWFAARGGIARYDGRYFTHYSTNNGLINNDVFCLLEDKKGNLWFGTNRGLSKFDGKSFTNYSVEQGLNSATIYSILEDHNGNIWIGTLDKGVCSFDGVSFTNYDIAHSVSHPMVVGMMEDKNHNLWFCTSMGVNKFDGKYFTWYTTEQGLSNNITKNVTQDKYGNIWIGTINGINLFRHLATAADTLKNLRSLFKRYTVSEGFSGGGSYENSITQDTSGNIWMSGTDRVTMYHPEGDMPDTIPPVIQLTNITLFDQDINWLDMEKRKDSGFILNNGIKLKDFNFSGFTCWYNQPQDLKLAYNNNYVTFQFIGITLTRSKEVRYQYFLEGLDEQWSSLTDKPEVAYNNLPHGKYTFRVKAVNSEGYWSKELNYSFTILPPWWRTWWLETIAAACIILAGYALMRWRIRQKFHLQLEHSKNEKQLAELQQQKTELEMQALRAQMNPHFIFNSLNSINRFILQNNRAQASEYLTKFSRLVRLILQNSQAALIPLECEMESLQLYLELERLRFDDHFSFKIIIGDELDTEVIKIPPLIIQPFAENAIWHGLMPKEEKGCLQVELFQNEEMLCCKITDDGIGRKKAEDIKSKSSPVHKSMGLRITEERIAMLRQHKQNKSSVQITDLVLPDGGAGGTEVLLKIPLII